MQMDEKRRKTEKKGQGRKMVEVYEFMDDDDQENEQTEEPDRNEVVIPEIAEPDRDEIVVPEIVVLEDEVQDEVPLQEGGEREK